MKKTITKSIHLKNVTMKKILMSIITLSLVNFGVFAQNWDQVIKTVASDRGAGDIFGISVSISGDKAIVGALYETEDVSGANTFIDAGSAYVFELSGGTWIQTAKLVASDRSNNDLFGVSVGISGDRAIVGAFYEDHDTSGTNLLTNAGSAYVFELSGGNWIQTTKLVASDRGAGDRFGYSVSINGEKAIVGAYLEDEDISGANTQNDAGSAYVFELSGNTWTETAKLVASDRDADDGFGVNVSISGDKAIIGAYNEDEDASGTVTQNDAGSAYVFELSGGTWTQTAKLVASDRDVADNFGVSVCISGDKVIVGAYLEDEDISGANTQNDAGSAYVFELIGGAWNETAKLVASDRDAADNFGFRVSISGDKAIVAAYHEDHDASGGNTQNSSGSAYVFELSGGTWGEAAKLVASDRGAEDKFGRDVSISGDNAIVGAYFEDEDTLGTNTLIDAGSAYVFATSSSVGLNKVTLENISVYPNPTKGIVNIDLGTLKNVTIQVLSTLGQVITQDDAINTSNYELSLNDSGIYFIKVRSNGEEFYFKVIKE